MISDYLDIDLVSDILKNTNKPMSISQIIHKFNPAIPFQVKCVRNILPDADSTPYNVDHRGIPVGAVINITEPPGLFGYYFSDYVVVSSGGTRIHPNLEKWVLV